MKNIDPIQLLLFCGAMISYIIYLYTERRKIFLYRFYSLRDKLYRLAITGEVNEKSLSFRKLSAMLNITIANSKEYKLKKLIEFSKNDALKDTASSEAFFADLNLQNEEIKKIAKDFFDNFAILLVVNQPYLYFIIQIKAYLHFIMYVLSPKLREIVNIYDTYKGAEDRISFAI